MKCLDLDHLSQDTLKNYEKQVLLKDKYFFMFH